MIRKVSLLFFLLTFSFFSHARLIQIIHTNDLHAYFEGYNGTGAGGYARALTMIKKLRADAAAKGIEVLQLDAGDWGEGTTNYLANDGVDSLRALELLGIDVATIGNHDHILGAQNLARQIRHANVKTKFTVANIFPALDSVPPFVDLDKGGIKIRVIGLTTNEFYFQYTLSPGKILPPVSIGETQAMLAKKSGRELVIALTHLGINKDSTLAENSSAIDVIIGGHSHTKLKKIKYVENLNGKQIPIAQAWAHGLAVGSLILDVKDNGVVKVVEYKIHETGTTTPRDPAMTSFIRDSLPRQNDRLSFPRDEVVGEIKGPISGYIAGKPVFKSSCWGRHMANSARLATGATVGLHLASFEGMSKPPGPFTYGDIANSYPHIRKYGDQGWEIATITMAATKLRILLFFVSRLGLGVSISGLGYKSMPDINDKGFYRVAIPAEVAYAVKKSMPAFRHFLQGLQYTGLYYWPVMADYVRKNTPLTCK